MREHPGVVGPVNGRGRAGRTREVRGGGRRVDVGAVLFLAHAVNCETQRAVRHVDDHVDALTVDPLARDGGADVGLVLVIAGHDFDRQALCAKILDRLTHARRRRRAANVAIHTGLVVQHADLDRGALGRGALGAGAADHREGGSGAHQGAARQAHAVKLPDNRAVCPCSLPARRWGSYRSPGHAPSRNAGRQRWRRSGNSVRPAAL